MVFLCALLLSDGYPLLRRWLRPLSRWWFHPGFPGQVLPELVQLLLRRSTRVSPYCGLHPLQFHLQHTLLSCQDNLHKHVAYRLLHFLLRLSDLTLVVPSKGQLSRHLPVGRLRDLLQRCEDPPSCRLDPPSLSGLGLSGLAALLGCLLRSFCLLFCSSYQNFRPGWGFLLSAVFCLLSRSFCANLRCCGCRCPRFLLPPPVLPSLLGRVPSSPPGFAPRSPLFPRFPTSRSVFSPILSECSGCRYLKRMVNRLPARPLLCVASRTFWNVLMTHYA
jgi:hypothetical protein